LSIGEQEPSEFKEYTRKTINYIQGDRIYMLTDGYHKQLNLEGASITKEVLLDQIHQIHDFDLDAQKVILEDNFKEWANETEQTDDVLILGIELK